MKTSKYCKEISIIRAIRKYYSESFTIEKIIKLLVNNGYKIPNSGRFIYSKNPNMYKDCQAISKKELDGILKYEEDIRKKLENKGKYERDESNTL